MIKARGVADGNARAELLTVAVLPATQ